MNQSRGLTAISWTKNQSDQNIIKTGKKFRKFRVSAPLRANLKAGPVHRPYYAQNVPTLRSKATVLVGKAENRLQTGLVSAQRTYTNHVGEYVSVPT